jgi:hypothetical protein
MYRSDGTTLDQAAPDPYTTVANYIGSLAWRNVDLSYVVPDPGAGKTWDYIDPIVSIAIQNSTGGVIDEHATQKVFDVRIDSVENYRGADPATGEVAKTGSMPPTYFNGFTYSSTSSSITPAWNISGYRTDLNLTTFAANSSQLVSGLSSLTSYNFYFFFDEVLAAVSAVATGGVGTPSWAHVGTNRAWTAEQAREDHIPLSLNPLSMATTSGGSGSGGGGGDGGCLRDDMLVEERTRGVIFAKELQVGDWIRCPISRETPDGWVEVSKVSLIPHIDWIIVRFTDGRGGTLDSAITTVGHPWTLTDGTRKTSDQLSLSDEIATLSGVTYPTAIEYDRAKRIKVSITVKSSSHLFYTGLRKPQIVTHNTQPSTL